MKIKNMIILSSGLVSGLVSFSLIGLLGISYGAPLGIAAMLVISIAMGILASKYD